MRLYWLCVRGIARDCGEGRGYSEMKRPGTGSIALIESALTASIIFGLVVYSGSEYRLKEYLLEGDVGARMGA